MILTERFSIETDIQSLGNGIHQAWATELKLRRTGFSANPTTASQIEQSAKWLGNPKGKPFLLLMGMCGNGKTTLALGISRLIEFVSERELGYDHRKRVEKVTAKQICNMIGNEGYNKAFQRLCNCEILVLDDLGEEPREVMSYGMIYTPLIDLISQRYAYRRMTIITTNLEGPELGKKYGERIIDRLREVSDRIVFTNDSYRGN